MNNEQFKNSFDRFLLCGQTVTGDQTFTPVKESSRPSSIHSVGGATVVAATPPSNNPVITVSGVSMETRTAGSHAVQVHVVDLALSNLL